ncbi:G-box-binding factor-like isoform X1 [Trichogramma pretiosum]|uniref:G-box-binding factor-like isoform X1 n=1 Tax=Trichogramma pretiosum TaxID=7493 RepID=UPI0006C94C6C|nr:G-box-binding factor-like isoform X1 [Trichogramma pretiosum]
MLYSYSSRPQVTNMNGKRPCPQPVRSHRPQQPQPMETNQSNPQNQHNQQHHHQQNQHQQHQHQQHQHQQNQHQQEPDPNSQHFDLIKYICESWNSVHKELHSYSHGNSSNNYRHQSNVTYYQEREPNPLMKDFKAFNLDTLFNQKGTQGTQRNKSS